MHQSSDPSMNTLQKVKQATARRATRSTPQRLAAAFLTMAVLSPAFSAADVTNNASIYVSYNHIYKTNETDVFRSAYIEPSLSEGLEWVIAQVRDPLRIGSSSGLVYAKHNNTSASLSSSVEWTTNTQSTCAGGTAESISTDVINCYLPGFDGAFGYVEIGATLVASVGGTAYEGFDAALQASSYIFAEYESETVVSTDSSDLFLDDSSLAPPFFTGLTVTETNHVLFLPILFNTGELRVRSEVLVNNAHCIGSVYSSAHVTRMHIRRVLLGEIFEPPQLRSMHDSGPIDVTEEVVISSSSGRNWLLPDNSNSTEEPVIRKAARSGDGFLLEVLNPLDPRTVDVVGATSLDLQDWTTLSDDGLPIPVGISEVAVTNAPSSRGFLRLVVRE